MARSFKTDSTDVYRQKVTRRGVHRSDGYYGAREGEAYETITFYGPYMSMSVGGDPWRHAGEVMTIEIQKLEAIPGAIASTSNGDQVSSAHLEWVTIKTKVLGSESE